MLPYLHAKRWIKIWQRMYIWICIFLHINEALHTFLWPVCRSKQSRKNVTQNFKRKTGGSEPEQLVKEADLSSPLLNLWHGFLPLAGSDFQTSVFTDTIARSKVAVDSAGVRAAKMFHKENIRSKNKGKLSNCSWKALSSRINFASLYCGQTMFYIFSFFLFSIGKARPSRVTCLFAPSVAY